MEFNGTFTLEDATMEEVWLGLSDPVMIKNTLPGCEYFVTVEDPEDVDFDGIATDDADGDVLMLPEADPGEVAERSLEEGDTYAAVIKIGVGSVKPTFNTFVTIDEREFPKMNASGEGSDSSNSFTMNSGMELSETADGDVVVEWWGEAEVFGRLAQMGQRVINPVVNRVVNKFFTRIENQLNDVKTSPSLRSRIRDLV